MVEALKRGEINTAFPVYGDLWDLEQAEIDASTAVVEGSETYFYRNTYNSNEVTSVAVNNNNGMQIAYCLRNFPNAELVYCSSINECLDAVLSGKADGTIVNTLRTQLVTGNSKYDSLSYIQLSEEAYRCFGVSEQETELLRILNRGIKSLGPSYGIDNSYQYMDGFFSYGIDDFVKDHAGAVCGAIAVLGFIIFAVLVRSLHRKEENLREKEAFIQQVNSLNSELETAAEKQKIHIQEVTALNTKLSERQIELEAAKQAAESANAAKTNFLFNMSHDIRTPMNAIMGFRDLLEKHQDDPEKRADYLRKIEDSSHVLLSIINNVLEMARIEKGPLEIEEKVCSVKDTLATLIATFDDLMRQKGILFTADHEIQNEYIFCDEVKLHEIFANILSNAYKYTNAGGTVTMHLREKAFEREGWTLYETTIADTGIGMSEEFLPHLFESFTREHNTTESKVEGTGLGMPIVKHLVDMLGGTIEVKSRKGEGSTFIVTIPHRIADGEEIHEDNIEEAAPRSFTGRRILLAEDNDLNAEIAEEILGEAGFSVERAEDGRICVDMLSRADAGYYDVILMDIQMPNMNGYEAARTIRAMEDPAKADIKIIAMTANAFEEDKRNALMAGMDGHLAKPIDVAKLMGTLNEILKENGGEEHG